MYIYTRPATHTSTPLYDFVYTCLCPNYFVPCAMFLLSQLLLLRLFVYSHAVGSMQRHTRKRGGSLYIFALSLYCALGHMRAALIARATRVRYVCSLFAFLLLVALILQGSFALHVCMYEG